MCKTDLAESCQYALITNMSDVIQAIVIDGFHKGHVVQMPYHPVLKLLKPTVVMVDTCCGGDEMPPQAHQVVEYKECFRAVCGFRGMKIIIPS